MAPAYQTKTTTLITWLLHNAQVMEGPLRGGVWGWQGGRQEERFVYGEITGYWLTWLSWLEQANIIPKATLAVHAECAVAFLGEIAREVTGPLTRVFPNQVRTDWRNDALFSFDLAMMIRGLSCASSWLSPKICEAAARALTGHLEPFVEEHGYLATHRERGVPLSDRWSSRPGPFQAKTAAALLSAPEDWISKRLREAATETLNAWVGRSAEEALLHPRFYALEGEAIAGRVPSREVILTLVKDGRLAESRADVLAQGLRLAVLAAAHDAVIHAMADALIERIDDQGGMPFDYESPHQNVWAAMFASQALHWAGQPELAKAAYLV